MSTKAGKSTSRPRVLGPSPDIGVPAVPAVSGTLSDGQPVRPDSRASPFEVPASRSAIQPACPETDSGAGQAGVCRIFLNAGPHPRPCSVFGDTSTKSSRSKSPVSLPRQTRTRRSTCSGEWRVLAKILPVPGRAVGSGPMDAISFEASRSPRSVASRRRCAAIGDWCSTRRTGRTGYDKRAWRS
jgi:hypothetical protein